MHKLKIYKRVMCTDNEEWCKTWRRIDLSVQKYLEEFDDFWPEHSKISKICTLMGSFWPKYIMFELKSKEELYFMTLESDAKFKEKVTCGLKNDMRNLESFHQSIFESLKIGTFMASFCLK